MTGQSKLVLGSALSWDHRRGRSTFCRYVVTGGRRKGWQTILRARVRSDHKTATLTSSVRVLDQLSQASDLKPRTSGCQGVTLPRMMGSFAR
jgi:hypothetical protein